MVIRKLVTAVFIAVMAIGVVAPRANATANDRKTMYLTFAAPVRLPGVALGSGTYIFEVANPETSGDVVRVLSRDRSIAYFMGYTRHLARPRSLSPDAVVSLGEAARGTTSAIAVWWPEGESTGRQFIYPR